MTIRQTKSRVFAFELSTGNPVTGGAAAITAKWAKDYGTPTALTDTNPVEAEDGFYHFDLSIAERDAEIIGEIYPESSTSGVQVIGVPAFFFAQTATSTGGASTCSPEISLSDLGSRRITWPTASESITGTIQWRGQAAKAITGAITFAETVDGVHFHDWAYNAADRPSEASWGIIVFTGGAVTDEPLVVAFVDGAAPSLTGPHTLTVTVTDTATAVPIENAIVKVSRTGHSESKRTNASGVAVFAVTDNTWTIEIAADGYAGESASQAMGAVNQSVAVGMGLISVTVPADIALATLVVKCLDEFGAIEPGVDIEARIIETPSGSTGTAFDAKKQVATSDVNGIAELTVVRLATYEYRRGKSNLWTRVAIPDAASVHVKSLIGVD